MENTYENKSVFSSMEQLENFLRKQEVENMAENKERKINVLGTEYKYFIKVSTKMKNYGSVMDTVTAV